MTTTPGPYLTDHRAVISTLNIKRVQPKRLFKKVRKLHAVSTDEWEAEFNPKNIMLSTKLDVNIESLATEFKRVLDVLAPIKTAQYHLSLRDPGLTKN